MLLFWMRVLLWVMMTTVSSVFLIVSKIFWWTLATLIGSFFFSGRISRVHLVVNRLFSIVAVVACSMRWLWMVFLALSSWPSCSLLLLKLSIFPFFNVTKSEMEFCFLFFDDLEAVTFLDDAIFSLVLLLGLVVSAFGFDFWVSSWRIWGDHREDPWLRM